VLVQAERGGGSGVAPERSVGVTAAGAVGRAARAARRRLASRRPAAGPVYRQARLHRTPPATRDNIVQAASGPSPRSVMIGGPHTSRGYAAPFIFCTVFISSA
jgi:hypothetical protein